MKLTSAFFLVLSVVLSYVAAEEVLTLTKDNFKSTIEENEFVLVEFYAPWCGHCKKLAPEYEKAAAAAKSMEPKVVIAKVDATAETDLASEFDVRGFPTLKWFVNGQVSEYSGGRSEATIVSWLKKKTGPPAKILKTTDDLESFKKEADAVVLGLFKDEQEAASFLKHAQTDDETPYAICYENCGDIAEKAGHDKTKSGIVVLQNFDAGKALFEGDFSQADAVKEFISGNLLPLVVPFSQSVAPKIFSGPVKRQLLLFVDAHGSDATDKLVESIKPVAEKMKGKLLFVSVAKSDSRILDFFGVKPEEVPAVRIVHMGEAGAKKYKYTETDITADSLEKFTNDYFEGKIPMDLKSEEIVPESEQGPVRVIVGKDFETIISQPGKDVLVEFYAPWCGHCKKLEPEYTALGEHFKDNANVVIAKMDATANEVEKVSIQGFPTIKFFPADSDEIIDYDGARDKAGMISFLEKNAKSLQ